MVVVENALAAVIVAHVCLPAGHAVVQVAKDLFELALQGTRTCRKIRIMERQHCCLRESTAGSVGAPASGGNFGGKNETHSSAAGVVFLSTLQAAPHIAVLMVAQGARLHGTGLWHEDEADTP